MATPISENPFENPQPEDGGRKTILCPMVRNIIFFGVVSMVIFLVFQFLGQNKEMKSKTYQTPVYVADTSTDAGSTQTAQEDEEAMLDTMSYEQIEAYKKRKAK